LLAATGGHPACNKPALVIPIGFVLGEGVTQPGLTWKRKPVKQKIKSSSIIITLAASSNKHTVTVWRVCPVCLSNLFSNLNRVCGAYST